MCLLMGDEGQSLRLDRGVLVAAGPVPGREPRVAKHRPAATAAFIANELTRVEEGRNPTVVMQGGSVADRAGVQVLEQRRRDPRALVAFGEGNSRSRRICVHARTPAMAFCQAPSRGHPGRASASRIIFCGRAMAVSAASSGCLASCPSRAAIAANIQKL